MVVSETIQRWEKWFEAVDLSDVWQVIKNHFPDEQDRIAWATMIELTRILEDNR